MNMHEGSSGNITIANIIKNANELIQYNRE